MIALALARSHTGFPCKESPRMRRSSTARGPDSRHGAQGGPCFGRWPCTIPRSPCVSRQTNPQRRPRPPSRRAARWRRNPSGAGGTSAWPCGRCRVGRRRLPAHGRIVGRAGSSPKAKVLHARISRVQQACLPAGRLHALHVDHGMGFSLLTTIPDPSTIVVERAGHAGRAGQARPCGRSGRLPFSSSQRYVRRGWYTGECAGPERLPDTEPIEPW